MKKLLTSIFFLASLSAGIAQHALVSGYGETTVAGPEYGASVVYETRSQWAFGTFFQRGFEVSGERPSLPSFYGAEVRMPLVREKKLVFLATLRAGLVNEKFVAVVPGFETGMTVKGRLVGSIGGAMRKGYPSLYARVGLRIF